MVLGRDFLQHYNVQIDHGSNKMFLGNNIISFNDAGPSKSVSFDNNLIIHPPKCLNTFDTISEFTSSEDEENSSDFPDPNCWSVEDTTVAPLSQRLVQFAHSFTTRSKTLFFEPNGSVQAWCLVGRSIHDPSQKCYCNIINTLDSPLTIKKHTRVGHFTKGTLMESNGDDELPLRLERINIAKTQASVFSNSSTTTSNIEPPANVDPDEWKNVCQIRIGDKLTDEQQFKLRVVLLKNYKAFQWVPNAISRTNLVEHEINTGDAAPIRSKQYPLPTIALDQIRKQAEQMLKDGTIRHSNSAWQSPILLIKQQAEDGSDKYRFCIDLRKVNAVTAKDSYSLPRIKETVDKLNGMIFFSNGDIDRAFWQVGVKESDKCKHAFAVDGRLYEGNVMAFGSQNAPATFQGLINTVLTGLTWKQCLAYIDDILIFSKAFDIHLQHIDEVLSRLINESLKLKPSKCSFGKHEVEYLGFRISDQGIQPSLRKVERLLKVLPPKTPSLLHSFLCGINFYRGEIPHYGHITADLYDMAASKTKFLTWADGSIKKFSKLQHALASAPILKFPDFDKTFYIQGDASAKSVGGGCLQLHETRSHSPDCTPVLFGDGWLLRPNVFFGRKLNKTERRWSATERELLALVYGYEICYHLVFGRKIVFLTDHKPLADLKDLKQPFGRLGQLLFKLDGVDFSIVYIPGDSNYLPDFLSRAHFANELEPASTLSISLGSQIDWAWEQQQDEELILVKSCIRSNADEKVWRKITNGTRWFRERADMFILDNVLLHSKTRFVVPHQLKNRIMQLHHDSPFAGHRAAETTFQSVSLRYYWNFMLSEIKAYCRSCEACQKYNYSVLHNRAPMKSIVVSRRNQIWVLDYMGLFKTSRHGNKYIILGVDAQDKWLEGAATPTFDTTVTAVFSFNNIICRYGMIEQILTDQGVSFENALFKELCSLCGTDKLHSSTYHAMGHGLIERVNRVVKPNLAKFVDDKEDDWNLYLQMAISSYNNSHHSSIGMSPYEARFGVRPTLVADVIMKNGTKDVIQGRDQHTPRRLYLRFKEGR